MKSLAAAFLIMFFSTVQPAITWAVDYDTELKQPAEEDSKQHSASSEECADNNSLAQLRGECNEHEAMKKEVYVIDLRNLNQEAAELKIVSVLRDMAKNESISERSRMMLNEKKNIRVLTDSDDGPDGTLLVAGAINRLLNRPDYIMHFGAGAITAKFSNEVYEKLFGKELKQKNLLWTTKVASFVTACVVGVAKEIYDKHHPKKHTSDPMDAKITCAGGAGIMFKTNFKF